MPEQAPTPRQAALEKLHDATRAQLATYVSHKTVRAAKIRAVTFGYDSKRDRGTTLLIPEDANLEPIEVTQEYVSKHDPHAPGYFVLYADGYESWSPVEAFENGYEQTEGSKVQDIAALAEGLAYRMPIDNSDRHRGPDEDVQAEIDGERGG